MKRFSINRNLINDDEYRLRSQYWKDKDAVGFEEVVNSITEAAGGMAPQVYLNEAGTRLKAIAFTNEAMLEYFRRFPRVVQIDGTYQKNKHGYPLYHVVCTDQFGHAHPVIFGMLPDEAQNSIARLLSALRFYAPEPFNSVKTVLVDKDYKESHALMKLIPDARVFLCQVHAIWAFRKWIEKKVRGRSGQIFQAYSSWPYRAGI